MRPSHDERVIRPTRVDVPRRAVAQLAPVIGADRLDQLVAAADRFRALVAGRTVWNISSTAVGGGVAEMLQALCGYVTDLDIDVRWMVIGGDADFFTFTKMLHNRIHGQPEGGDLGAAQADHYAAILASNAPALVDQIRPGHIVL